MFSKALKLTFLFLFLVSVLQPALLLANDIKVNSKDDAPLKTKKKDVITYKSSNPKSMGNPDSDVVKSCKDSKYVGLVSKYKSAYASYVAANQNVKYINGVIDKSAQKKIDAAFKKLNSLRYQMTQRYKAYLKESQPVIKAQSTSNTSTNSGSKTTDSSTSSNQVDNKKLSDNGSSSGDQFTACGKTWKVGPKGCSWNEAQNWINGLGGGWRTPTMAELNELYSSVKDKSLIGDNWVWSTKKDSDTAWFLRFDDGGEGRGGLDGRCGYRLAVAVLSR